MKLEKVTDSHEGFVKEELPKDDPSIGKFFNVREILPGLKAWKNPENQFTVARLHYTADPAKRSAEWKRAARAGITFAQWMREYEILWTSFEGMPVYGDDFTRTFHVSDEPLEWNRHYPVVRGWDFGLGASGMACVFAQLLVGRRLWLLREITSGNTDIEHFAPEVARLSVDWFPGCVKFFDVVDPTGFNRSQIDKRSCASVVNVECHTRCVPGERSQVKRRKAVTDFLQRAVKGKPGLLVDAQACPMIVGGFEGGYHYAYAKDGQLKDEPEKNIFSHAHDGVQMIASRIEKLEVFAPKDFVVPSPTYNFGQKRMQ